MFKVTLIWLSAIGMTITCLSAPAEVVLPPLPQAQDISTTLKPFPSTTPAAPKLPTPQPTKVSEKLIGRWSHHAGAISFFLTSLTDGAKQARMLTIDEGAENKVSFDLHTADLEDMEELVEETLKNLGDPNSLPVPPIGTRTVTRDVGSLFYPSAKIRFSIVDAAAIPRYVSLVVEKPSKTPLVVYWMEKADLKNLESLLEKTLALLGES